MSFLAKGHQKKGKKFYLSEKKDCDMKFQPKAHLANKPERLSLKVILNYANEQLQKTVDVSRVLPMYTFPHNRTNRGQRLCFGRFTDKS
jgi:hypothetical protein